MKNYQFALIAFLFLFGIQSNVLAQKNFGYYNGMQNLPQSHYYNPSWNAKNKLYFSIGTGMHSVGISNSGFALKDVLVARPQDDSLVISPAGAIDKMARNNFLSATAQNELLGFGIKVKQNYFSFAVINRFDFSFAYPKDFVKLIFEGNGGSLLGQRANMDGLGLNMNSYMEYGVGFNREFLDAKLKVGVRAKLLSGIANVHTKKSVLGLTTDQETFDLTIDGALDLRTSGIPDSTQQFDQSGAYNFKNHGTAFDFGATYAVSEKLKITASILDVGSIKWTQNVHNYNRTDFTYTFKGADINQALNDSNYLQNIQDTLKNVFLLDKNSQSYRTALPTRIILGGNYDINSLFGVGAVWFSDFANKKYRPTLSLTGTLHVKNWLFVNLNYSMTARSAKNIGFGFALKGLGMSYFVATDNILAALNPAGAKVFHISTGLGFCIGRTDKDKINKAE